MSHFLLIIELCVLFIIPSVFSTYCKVSEWSTITPPVEYTSMQFTVTSEGLSAYIPLVVDRFEKYIVAMVIPDVEGSMDLGIAHIDYNITEIILKEFSLPSAQLTVDNGAVVFDFSGIDAELDFDWLIQQQEWPYITDNGYGVTTLTNLSLLGTAVMALNPDCPGLINMTFNTMTADYDSLDITLYGGASWLYDLIIEFFLDSFKTLFTELIQSEIKQLLETTINDAIDNATVVFGNHNFGRNDDRYLSVYSGADYLSYGLHGTVQVTDDFDTWYGDVHAPDPLPTLTGDHHFQFMVSPVAWESYYATFIQKDGWFRSTLNENDINGTVYDGILDVDTLLPFLPALDPWAGKGKTVSIKGWIDSVPTFKVMPVAVLVDMTVHLNVTVQKNDIFALDCSVQSAADADVYVKPPDTCEGNANFPRPYFRLIHSLYGMSCQVAWSDVGDVVITSDLEQLLAVFFSEAALPWLSDRTKDSVKPLDVYHISPFEVSYGPNEGNEYVAYRAWVDPDA
eukprot:gnl/Dysnectes_brevis/4308_a5724_886.p1 GENE.gnl/Dysnectes_brevis/4308_a5724_886~~gnl/Dysnectes_brevis/4308_a5724_886.p1  ORF type:complete len:511 (-),score=131.22 gnl/Dysnectes_brevis/4308_a5724_886:148-1680(-)